MMQTRNKFIPMKLNNEAEEKLLLVIFNFSNKSLPERKV